MMPAMREAGGLPPFMMTQPETGQSGNRDASFGLETEILDGKVWAQNPLMGDEWQLVYLIEPPGLPSGLSGLSMEMYGTPSRYMDIYNVPQNKAIQGPDVNVGLHVGDTILIPGLEPAQSPGGANEQPGTAPGGGVTPTHIVFNGGPGTPVSTKETTTRTTTTTTEKDKASWWTPGRSAAVAGGVVGATVLAVWMFGTRKKKKRRRRRKRRR